MSMEQDTRALLPTQGTAWATASVPVARLQGPQGDSHQACSQEPHSPPSAEAPYCDLPRCPPALQDPLHTTTCVGQSVDNLGLGLDQEPQRIGSPTTALPADPRNRHRDPEAIPYLEGPAYSTDEHKDEDPNSNTSSSQDSNTPHDTSNSSSVQDWDTVERPGVVPNRNRLTMMIPRRPQEGLRTDSAQKVTRSPARGDTAGQRKENSGSGGQSAGQHWVKLRSESGYFSLERQRSGQTQASSGTPPSGPRTTTQASSAQRDVSQAASAQEAPQTSSLPRNTQRDTQRSTPRTSSPSRVSQRDTPRIMSTQRKNTPLSSPLRPTPETLKTSAPEDGPHVTSPLCAQDSSLNRTTQRDSSRTSCAQRNNPRTSSPNRTTQRDNPRTSCAQRNNPRTSSPNRTTQQDNPRTSCAQRNNPRTSSPSRTTQHDNPRTSCAQRDNPRTSSPNRTTQQDNPRMSCAQRNNPRTSSPNRTTQRDNLRTSCAQRNNPRTSSPNRTIHQDNPRTSCVSQNTPRTSSTQVDKTTASCSRWEHLRSACTQRDNPRTLSQGCTQKDNPGPSSPHRATQGSSSRNPSPHRTNKDIPWASFPLRPTQSDSSRTSSPSRTKQNQVPWASISLRPTQGDKPQTSAPSKLAHNDPPQQYSPSLATSSSSSHNPGHPSASRTSSPLHPAPRGAPQTSLEPSQPPCAVCIGHRDAPRASSPPRYFQYDPFPFFPDPRSSESESPHHEPPYMPPAVCIGHRDAPRATSPPRHTQFDPFPFLPDTSDAENESPQHDPPQFPPPVCIGYRDAPRASSPPRQFPEPSFFQDLPRASTESLVPSTDSMHEPPHIPTPVCIGHRDAPSFSSPPRQAPEPSLFFQDPPGTSMESLAPSVDSLHGSPLLLPQVCIGHRDAPRASSPPRHPPSDVGILAPSPPPGSSGSRGSAPPGETRHNLEREEYTMLADLPPPRRLAQRVPEPQAQGSNEGRTRSPGRAEVERLFGQERRKSEAPGAFQARDEGRSQRPSQGQSQLRRQSSPAPSRQVTKPSAKQAEPTRQSRTGPPHPKSPEKHSEGDRQLQRIAPPARTSARPPERKAQIERHLESGYTGLRQPLGGWQSREGLSGPQSPNRHPEKNWGSQEEGLSLGGWPELGGPSLEGIWRGPPQEHRERWGQSEAWEEPPSNGIQGGPPRGQGSLQELPRPHQPPPSPENSWAGPAECFCARQPEAGTAMGWRAEGTSPHQYSAERPPDLDWRDLLGLLRAPEDGAWTRLPRLDWEGLLELLQARLPQKDPTRHSRDPAKAPGPEPGSSDTEDTLKTESQTQPEGWAKATLANGHRPGQQSESPAQLPSPACTSTQWPTTKVTSGPETSPPVALEQIDHLESHSPPDLGPDLLNFKKGWMSILDEPGEWKKHWFVLTDSSLKYYRDSTAEEADELDGEIDLRSCTDVTEYAVQRNYGFQIHTKDAVYTLSAMTSGIRRNWIEALRKTVRPTSAPDVTKLSECNKENTLHGYGTQKSSLKIGEQRTGSEVIGRGGPRKVDGSRQSLDYVELSPLTPSSPQRVRTLSRSTPERPSKQEDLERDLAQRSEERRKWFESTDSRTPETPSGDGSRRGLGAPLTDDQQSRLSEEIEKKWQELEKLPLRENKRVPLTALLNQGHSERRGPTSDSHEALEKEVQSLRAQLEAWRLRGEAPQNAPRLQEDSHIPPGYISQEACERSLAEMESSHQQVMEQLQRHHERELQRLQQEKEWLLAEETAATASAIEAMKKAYQEELSRELSKTRSLQQGPDSLRKQHQLDMEALKQELQVLSERYSQKCLEIGALTRQAEEREHTLRCCQQEGQELLRHNQELHSHLSEEIDRLRSFIASQGTGNSCGRSNERSSCELEVLLRVKENELQYLKKEVQCLRDELQVIQKDKRFTGKYQDVYVELNHIKTRSEREIEQLKEHLRLAMAALQEKEAVRNSLAE
ncbi:TRIO and F-actin-binding protein isoform X1 [Rattus norvegicus]|uniref:TRIO and F-actin-binding protein isoform X1 n=1 Tax=Rattus norvegicus TaxID=10116 RepID=UPI0008101922|nr:TRIO and F-actin-binding protein isoform X1 [Rattus norvegicus]XP_038935507.1 TRIO and F-actin-binding protein isoform X1 [Rattus norvegicus]|eukprot:XP_017450472.1 PREDICTED: TRIO and F-actin-binding protein isoform X5 [Rattus norvegicus]